MLTAIHKHTSHTVSFNTYRVLFNTDGATLASADRTRYREIVILWDLDAALLLQGEIPEDVNGDGVLNIQDLVFIAANFGQTGLNAADVNGDGIVDIRDLVKVASAIAAAAAAPPVNRQALAILTTADVQQWLFQAQQLNLTDPVSQRGIRFLRTTRDGVDTERDGTLTKLPEPVQSRNVDTLSVSGSSRGHVDSLCRGWNSGADVGIRASTCWCLS